MMHKYGVVLACLLMLSSMCLRCVAAFAAFPGLCKYSMLCCLQGVCTCPVQTHHFRFAAPSMSGSLARRIYFLEAPASALRIVGNARRRERTPAREHTCGNSSLEEADTPTMVVVGHDTLEQSNSAPVRHCACSGVGHFTITGLNACMRAESMLPHPFRCHNCHSS